MNVEMWSLMLFLSSCTIRYDPKMNKWHRVSAMTTPRLGVGVASLGGYLYAVGGSDGESPLATAERLDLHCILT